MFIAKDPLWQLRFAKFFIIALGKEFYKDFLQDQFGLRKKKKKIHVPNVLHKVVESY
jgi:hypothetical protein